MTWSSTHPSGALLLCSVVLAACSALDLGEHEIIACDPNDSDGDAECDVLNAGLPEDECTRYYCSKSGRGGCAPEPRDDDRDGLKNRVSCSDDGFPDLDCDDGNALRDGRPEQCDGIDNDCNGLIDDGVTPEQIETDVTIPTDIEHLSRMTTPDGTLHIALTYPNGDLLETTRVTVGVGALPQSSVLLSSNSRCDAREGSTEGCSIGELAIEATDDVVLAAGVHLSSCDQGQLRLGLASAALPLALELGEAEDDSSTFGVDIDFMQSCTRSTECLGARRPAVALLGVDADAVTREALVAWLAPMQSEPCAGEVCDCRGTERFQIEGFGLRIDPSPERPRFLGAQAAQPSVLGSTPATGEPVVTLLSKPDRGYLLGYPSSSGVELTAISSLGEGDAVGATLASARIEAVGASHLAIARDPVMDRGLAIAFRTSRGGRDTVQLVALSLRTATQSRELKPAEPVLIEDDAEVVLGPAVAYAGEGFSSSSAQHGGWLVVWGIRDGRETVIKGARIAEAELVLIAPEIELARGPIEKLFTYSKQSSTAEPSLHYGFVTNGTLHINRLNCEMAD